MSDRQVVPEHDDGYWRRWEMDELGTPERDLRQRERSRQEAIRQQLFKRNAELEALREKARQEAYDDAYKKGFEEGRQAGYEKGLEEGRTAGEQELQRQTQQALAPLLPLAEGYREALDTLDDEVAERLVDLALTTGRQLAREALEARPEVILDIVRELLHAEPSLSGRPRLWLHPADLTLVKAHLGAEFDAAGWQLQPDDTISRGGCRATSASGELDASLESRWERITRQVRRRHNDGQNDTQPGEQA
ncbi:flagellar assembly protein FliH [Halomonas sp. McH1-25]|uniref:flagellar assembly protein FliH n=1 Tax=unclassified Halomonas TaxID=2609666 RepID=UPI001EF3E5BA|nr:MULTISPECIES: flagellar assembly protein FliH [unclassified Halomonas]MCG7598645.1 flagellar assembly protein FliH [Halomonas sp. McH1-25]MCP1343628.1 flagellar assembly protein FliH [Halomonas sp. FL8]MCP1359379.1 flagellar assembly protein FliH [Halomonas sp. BBD45]